MTIFAVQDSLQNGPHEALKFLGIFPLEVGRSQCHTGSFQPTNLFSLPHVCARDPTKKYIFHPMCEKGVYKVGRLVEPNTALLLIIFKGWKEVGRKVGRLEEVNGNGLILV